MILYVDHWTIGGGGGGGGGWLPLLKGDRRPWPILYNNYELYLSIDHAPSSSFKKEDLLPKTNSLIKLLSNLIDSHNTTLVLGI